MYNTAILKREARKLLGNGVVKILVWATCPQDGGTYRATFRSGGFYMLERKLPGCQAERKPVDFWTAIRAAIQYRRWARGLEV